ncbi:sulfurtransferase TusA family protein [Streptomyces sp. SS7]|uniref:sulfurtransferase TusA family protein n=1 Tax=Streptomyces sp. SS7 TaxID=3108485 RepID=UPI0030EE45C9
MVPTAAPSPPAHHHRAPAALPPADLTVDGTGLLCVTLLLKLRTAIDGVKPGTIAHVIATDPAALLDLPAWCLRQLQRLRRPPPQILRHLPQMIRTRLPPRHPVAAQHLDRQAELPGQPPHRRRRSGGDLVRHEAQPRSAHNCTAAPRTVWGRRNFRSDASSAGVRVK